MRRGPITSVRKPALTLAASFIVALLAAAPANAAFPGANGKIANAQFRQVGHSPGDPDIHTVNPDGSGDTQLTTGYTSSQPAWSPDGTKIVFYSTRSNGADIYVMNADGSGVVRLTNDGTNWMPAWSPDGTKIVFVSTRGNSDRFNGDLYTINADGSGVTQITSGAAYDRTPVWSPDGTEIAFSRYTPDPTCCAYTEEILGVGVDGSGERLIVGNKSANPNWSPDGTKLAYDHGGGIWTINSDGTGAVEVIQDPDPDENTFITDRDPAWSPDGTKIAFEVQGCGMGFCGNPAFATVNQDGTGRTSMGPGGEPDWQPVFGYARPRGATPVNVRFVPAFTGCAGSSPAGMTHGPPLAVPSCQPPQPTSQYLTMGTADSNGQASNFTGELQLKSICNPPAPSAHPPCTDAGDQADLKLDAQFTDVRNATTLTDYTGELQVKTTLRITDRVNGPTGANPATTVDVPFSFTVPCSGDGDTTIGSTCSVSTTADAVNPGIVPEGKRSVWNLGQVQVYDGGADGVVGTADNTLFLTQGLFAP